VEEALRRPHPVEAALALEPPLARALFDTLVDGPVSLAARREATLARLVALAETLQPDEARLHASLHPDVRAVLKGKRLLLFKHLLKEVGYQDQALMDDVVQGFRLSGQLPSSPEFPQTRLRAATLSREQLWCTARWSQAVALQHKGGRDPPVDEAVYLATQDEVAKGWLLGPYTPQQLEELVGPRWVPSRRFGVVQGGKVRPIDDFSEF
jgi:hypothetical protein